MISVAEDYLRFYILFQLLLAHDLHAANCSHGHENGGLYQAMIGGDGAGSCFCLRIGCFKLEL